MSNWLRWAEPEGGVLAVTDMQRWERFSTMLAKGKTRRFGISSLVASLFLSLLSFGLSPAFSTPGTAITGSSDGLGDFSVSVNENFTPGATVTTLASTGVGTPSWSTVGGADILRMSIIGTTGEVVFVYSVESGFTSLDFENPRDTEANGFNTYTATYRVRYDNGTPDNLTDDTAAEQSVTVTVLDRAEITSNGGEATAAISVAENSTAVTTVTANGTAPAFFSIEGGADSTFFAINGVTGALSFRTSRNFEAPADDGADNTYIVVVRASVSVTDTYDQTITVTITDVDEIAPTITNDGGGATAAISIAENTTAVTTVTATDTGGLAAAPFSLNGGADAARFSINEATGDLTITARDFETPQDLGDTEGDNTYVVNVRATDLAGNSIDQTITVTITNALEPSATYSQAFLNEVVDDIGAINGAITITLTDETFAAGVRGTNLPTSRVTNVPAGLTPVLAINAGGTAAYLSFTGQAEENTSVNSVNDVTVTFVDADFTGGNVASVVGANRNNLGLNFAGAVISGTAETDLTEFDITIPENTTYVTTMVGNTAGVAVWAKSEFGDGALFSINAAGVLSFIAPRDFETPVGVLPYLDVNQYAVQILLIDPADTSMAARTVIVQITDVIPAISAKSVSGVNSSGATINFTTSEAGTYYYLVTTNDVLDPTLNTQVKTGAGAGRTGSAARGSQSVNVTGLAPSTGYSVFLIVEDGSLNLSALELIGRFTTAVAPALPVAPVRTTAEIEADKKALEAAEKLAVEEAIKREIETKARVAAEAKAREEAKVKFEGELKSAAETGKAATMILLAPVLQSLEKLNIATKLLDKILKSPKKKLAKKPRKKR